MKIFRIFMALCALLLISLIPSDVNASWYAGSEFDPSNGIRAYIKVPVMLSINSGGESNWVSTFYYDENGTDWIQSGWKYYSYYSGTPKQYVEWCVDYAPGGGPCHMYDSFSEQFWGTTVHYQVQHEGSAKWCAYTGGYLRLCVNDLHLSPTNILAKSEIHESLNIPLNTDFDVVQYLDPVDSVWKNFDNRVYWHKQFPYSVDIISNSRYRTYRIDTFDLYLPILFK